MSINVFITLDGHIISVFVIALTVETIVLTVLLFSECMCVALDFCNVCQRS